MQLTFLGLGVMGYPMAGHLQENGHDVCVYNRSPARAESWAQAFGGRRAAQPDQAAQGADIVFVCVGNDDDVRDVVLGAHGALANMKEGAVLVDHTTASAELARELDSEAKKRGVGFIDAPVSGGQAGAENGVLTVMAGGDALVFDSVVSVIKSYARCVKLLGPVGSGQLAKMVNQICIAGVVQGLSEGLHFAQQAGLNPADVIEVISQGAAQSWQMENRYQTMLADQYEHGFAVDWMRKDLALVLAESERLAIDLPVTKIVDDFYADVQDLGGNRWDTSSLLVRLQELHKRNNKD